MGNIVLLDDLTINKIAAGEVIERPASVVKELVENSIDAGAKNITVEIKNGGISLIKITDDGCGIAEDDMEIAFERHATSKIRRAEDLEMVKSMGFRGEALASIAAIANVEMISKKVNTEVAHKIVVEGGKIVEFTEAARSVGTTITVQNLFFNTPVRYKFLKKDYTEAGYIEDVMTRIALVNKEVAIKLVSNGKTVVQTNGNGDLQTVIYSIFGKDIASEIIEVEYEYDGMKIHGAIGKPVIARANRVNQLFFLNGRFIKDKNLSAAAEQAYKGMIPIGRYGFLVLNLEIDPRLVDVNVHPAKLEVRFEDEGKVFKAIYHAIKSNLAKSELVEHVEQENLKPEKTSVFDVVAKRDVKNDFTDNTNEYEKKSGISGLFQKILKEPEETAEELNNNHLEEIFKYRQGLKNNNFGSTNYTENYEGKRSADSILSDDIDKFNTSILLNNNENKTETFENTISNNFSNNTDNKFSNLESNFSSDNISNSFNTINDNEIDKKLSFGNTIISSDTKELDVNNVNEVIKDATTELLTTKLMEIQETQTINTAEVRKEEFDKTQPIDTEIIKEVSQDTLTINNSQLNSLPQHTAVLDNKEEIKEHLENDNAFSTFAEKMITAKLGFDNTQMIDTNKVRELLKEEKIEKKAEEKIEENPEFDQMYKKTFGVDPFSVRREKELENIENKKINVSNEFSYAQENMNVFDNHEETKQISYKFLGIAFSTYIIIEIKDEMYIVDQHAAHERIMYEQVKANYYSGEVKDEQFLLLPDLISLTHKEMIIARENIEMFAKAGFSFEEFGENTIKLMSVPSMCEELNTKQLFLDILDEIDTIAVTARQEKEDKFIATVACKAAVKAKMKLDEQEVKILMERLLELPNPFTCPHGRPTAIKMTRTDLEKKFSRR